MTIEINDMAAQGDLLITKIKEIPNGMREKAPVNQQFIAAHSETGHHHTVFAGLNKMYKDPEDPFICYLQVNDDFADFVHMRDYDTHETIRVKKGNYKLTNQQEYGPEGWQRAAD